MSTDWGLIRDVLNAAINSCEHLEEIGYDETHRSLSVPMRGKDISVNELLISAWTLPENVRYHVIRQRHDQQIDLPYVPESARILNAVMAACAELIGSGSPSPADASMRQMIVWYRDIFSPNAEKAIAQAERKDEPRGG